MSDFEHLPPDEFQKIIGQAGAPERLPAELRERKLFTGRGFHPPIRRVPVIVIHAEDRFGQKITVPCPVLRARKVSQDHYECILLVAETPRTLTTVALVPVAEIESPNTLETEIEW